MRKSLLSLGLFAALAAPSAFAQMPACSGTYTRIRVSTVKPGMMEQFKKAVAANLAWYRSKGITTNNIVFAAVIDYNPADKTSKYSETEAMTYHTNPPQRGPNAPAQDDAYKAFVKMYDDSSTIKETYDVCLPKM